MRLNRRELLLGAAGLLGVTAVAGCGSDHTAQVTSDAPATRADKSPAPGRHTYGRDPSQFGDLYRPVASARAGTVVVIHGGFWQSQYDLALGAPLAADLAGRGYTVFNLEYRRIGNGGGWPTTLQDIAAGIDLLATLSVDTTHVVAIGHSAGGQLAAWAAGRHQLAPTAPGANLKVAVTAVVSQAGVLDLATAQRQSVGGTAEAAFLGGTADQVPERYAVADPIQQVPLAAPVLCVHSRDDRNVPFAQSTAYVAAATAAGATATLAQGAGDHFTLIDPASPAWATVVAALPGLLAH